MSSAMIQRLDDVMSIKTFVIALALSMSCVLSLITYAGLTGTVIDHRVQKTINLPTQDTVQKKSNDLSQLDIRSAPPSTSTATIAGKPQPRTVTDMVEGLGEKTPYGIAPIIRKTDGLTPFKAYSSTFAVDPNAKALVSFVVMDYGLSDAASAAAVANLPEGVSFMLDANSATAQKWTSEGRKYNHEIWLSLPLQNVNYPTVDSGPKSLLTTSTNDEFNKRFLQTLSLATGYAGVIAPNTSPFTKTPDRLNEIVTAVYDRGLGIVASDPTDTTLGKIVASSTSPYGHASFLLDTVSTQKDIQSRLIDIESHALADKKIIVFIKPYPAIIKALQQWIPEAGARGIQIAPLSVSIQK